VIVCFVDICGIDDHTFFPQLKTRNSTGLMNKIVLIKHLYNFVLKLWMYPIAQNNSSQFSNKKNQHISRYFVQLTSILCFVFFVNGEHERTRNLSLKVYYDNKILNWDELFWAMGYIHNFNTKLYKCFIKTILFIKPVLLREQNIDLYVGFFYYIKNLDLTINF
jgi:hypothetical protein